MKPSALLALACLGGACSHAEREEASSAAYELSDVVRRTVAELEARLGPLPAPPEPSAEQRSIAGPQKRRD